MTLVSLDTNVLIYSIDLASPKQPEAEALLTAAIAAGAMLTLQALGEFYHVAVRKRLATAAQARAQVERFLPLFGDPVAADVDTLRTAMDATQAQRFSFWDAMLLATAEQAGCEALISEDMAPGARLGGIRVVPAFAGVEISPEAAAVLAGP